MLSLFYLWGQMSLRADQLWVFSVTWEVGLLSAFWRLVKVLQELTTHFVVVGFKIIKRGSHASEKIIIGCYLNIIALAI